MQICICIIIYIYRIYLKLYLMIIQTRYDLRLSYNRIRYNTYIFTEWYGHSVFFEAIWKGKKSSKNPMSLRSWKRL